MPHQGILRLQHPMVLIRKHQQPARHASRLKHVERRQALGHGQAVVELAMDDQLRRRPLVDMACGIPLLVPLSVLVQSPLEVVDRKEELVRVPLGRDAEAAVVADEGFEFAAEGMALDPVWSGSRLVFGWGKGKGGGYALIMYPP